MAEGSGAFGMQVAFLFRLVFRLKSWKMLTYLLVIPAVFINFVLFDDIEDEQSDDIKTDGLTELDLKTAFSRHVLLKSETREQTPLLRIMSARKGSTKGWVKTCESLKACKTEFVKSVVSRSEDIYSFMFFGTPDAIALYCLNGGKAQIMCPFLYHAMSQALEYGDAGESVFKDVTFAKLYDRNKGKSTDSKFVVMNISTPDSMCTRTTRSGLFLMYFQLFFMVHLVILTAAFILHYTVGTLSTISNLKENNFLQLVFNSGLSVSAFWLVYWIITLLEIVIFVAFFMLAYVVQCPGYYKMEGLLSASLMICVYLVSIAAIGLLFATILTSFFIILLLMIVLQLVVSVMMMMLKVKMLKDRDDPSTPGFFMTMLIFPPGNIAEYCIERLLPPLPKDMKPPPAFDTYYSSLGVCLVVAPVVLILVTIYIDFIVRNGNGLCLPCGYPFNPNFWNPHRQKLIEMVDNQPRRANVEPTTGIPAVIANDIFMTYPSGLCGPKRPPVLRGVTCTVYQGQITALIGHNGAGKTTLIRVLMGEEIPTSGVAIINGHRVTDPYQRLALRGAVSICKQVDVLSNYLTVMESMQLTLVAKGFSVDSQVNKVLDMMRRLGLAGKEHVQAMDLSGGQMRKVCSIICLLGNPRLVILDEPTSGLDPVSRRNLWQILKENRTGRSIILCTQFMDEADILAERKMFLSAGKLICAGSSIFLKHAFGCCLTINVSLKRANEANQLMRLLKKVKVVSQFQTELQLQVMSEKPQILANAVQTLESHPELVDAFGVSQAQLDDIFMRLKFIDMDNIEASFKSKKLRKLGRGTNSEAAGIARVDFSQLYDAKNAKPYKASLGGQFAALMRMNLSRQWKAKVKFCFRIIFPLILVLAIGAVSSMANKNDDKKDNNDGKAKSASQLANEQAGESQKSKVLTNMNSSAARKSYNFQMGFCIYDSDDPFLSSRNQSDLLKLCSGVFFPFYGKPIPKKSSVSMKTFAENDGKKIFREMCRKSDTYIVMTCFYVYMSSWDPDSSKNNNRELYIGQYENPADAPDASVNLVTVHNFINSYVKPAKYLSAHSNSDERNFSIANMYMIETLKGLKFQDCYELMVYVTAFALIPVTYLNDPIEDKDCGVRQHLASMGMSTMAYWFNTFILHWIHYIFCFLIVSLACLMLERYQNAYFFVNMVLPVMFLGTSSSQLSVYVVSATMKKTNAMVLVIYFFFAMFLGIVMLYVQGKYTTLIVLLFLLPPFTPVVYLMMGMKILVYAMLFFNVESADEAGDIQLIYSSSAILMMCLLAMPVHILILMGLIAFIENPGAILSICAKTIPPSSETAKAIKDVGVQLEADRIKKAVRNSANLMEVRDLQKVYPNGVRAVRGTTFGAIAGEILGLLGPNGAGKTTSMSIIVGEEAASSGCSEVHFTDTWMTGIDGAHCGAIGYCPQHNPLFNQISVFEHLSFYAQIRGLPSDLAGKQIAGLIDGLGLKPHQAKAAEQLSGGNKRRLCLAIALLGNPALVVIDEASTGVDPENKRFIWGAIRGMASKFRSVMITTHSMEEVEALCSRVGIMNKGVMIGFGTVQQLRSRHGEAYTLDVLMKANNPLKLSLKKKKLAKRVSKEFRGATVMEDLMSCMQFNLPRKNIASFSGAMRWLISKKRALGIQYFTLYQMSLDQVFVKLVKEYDES